MNRVMILLASASALAASSASAGIVTIAQNVDFSKTPFTFSVNGTDTFTLTYAPQGDFDFSPTLVRTGGNAAVVSVFGNPAVSFQDRPALFGPNAFPGFASFPTDTRAGASGPASDLGLRYGVEGAYYYGYVRFAFSDIERVAFSDIVNAPVLGGAVPEPATWAMMIIGVGAVGGAMRRRRVRTAVSYA